MSLTHLKGLPAGALKLGQDHTKPGYVDGTVSGDMDLDKGFGVDGGVWFWLVGEFAGDGFDGDAMFSIDGLV
ncbi:hypothetical protein Tco_0086923 [Tanacetum coccineum]